MTQTSVSIDIEAYRERPTQREWELPQWGHPISQGVLPLCVVHEDRLIPVGTAFTFGGGVRFIISAAHNIKEALKREERLSRILFQDHWPVSSELRQVGISVLHHRANTQGGIDFTIWPIETVAGGVPTDIVFGYPTFHSGVPTINNRLSFGLPRIGEKVWSIGYSDFRYPKGGIPLLEVAAGTFDWLHDYQHRLNVVEAGVERVFVHRFAAGFVDGPWANYFN